MLTAAIIISAYLGIGTYLGHKCYKDKTSKHMYRWYQYKPVGWKGDRGRTQAQKEINPYRQQSLDQYLNDQVDGLNEFLIGLFWPIGYPVYLVTNVPHKFIMTEKDRIQLQAENKIETDRIMKDL